MRKISSALLDIIFPPQCHLCKISLSHGDSICHQCFENLPRINNVYCMRCSEPFEGEFSQNPICPNCHKLDFTFEYSKSALKNSELTRKLIIDYKYGKQRHLAKILASCCAEVIRDDNRYKSLPSPVLIPVPLHWRRKLMRGFNQAGILAEEISKITGIPSLPVIQRTRYTTTQTRLSRKQRMLNLKNAFLIKGKLAPFKTAILIDDVFTTGSTSEACASLLKKEYPKLENIVVVTALRG